MRTPRNIDAELSALAHRAKHLKQRKITQLGELVIATGAGELEVEHLAGILVAAMDGASPEMFEEWRAKGRGFFRKNAPRRPGAKPDGDAVTSRQDARSDPAGAVGGGAA
jgi:hypothetical protein